jgi:cell division protein ZapA (FtsZ GTPase activity inhibitor)
MGVEYPVRGDFNPEYIAGIAAKLDQRMRELADLQLVKSTEKIALFTALNLENELYDLKQEREQISVELSRRIERLIAEVEGAIKEISK